MRHSRKIRDREPTINVFAHSKRELRLRPKEFRGLDVLAQPDNLALTIRHLNSNRALSRHALDQDALCSQRETQIVSQSSDAAVFNPSFRLELERGNDWTRIDLRHLSMNIELRVFVGQNLCEKLQLTFIDTLRFIGTMQQA